MKISDIQTGMSNVELVAKVVEKGEVRQVNTRFGPSSVCDCVIEDDTGHMKLTLWSKQIDTIKIGDNIEVKGGYVREWREEKQISIARSGSITVVPGDLPSLKESKAPAKKPAKGAEEPADDEESEEEPSEEVIEETF